MQRIAIVSALVLSIVAGSPAGTIHITFPGQVPQDIPDGGGPIEVMQLAPGLPAGARVTGVYYAIVVDDRGNELDFSCSDYRIALGAGASAMEMQYVDLWSQEGGWNDGGADDDWDNDSDIDLAGSIHDFDGFDPGLHWGFVVEDRSVGGAGRVTAAEITIDYILVDHEMCPAEDWSFSPQTVVEYTPGQSFFVSASIVNSGDSSLGSFTVRFYASSDTTITPGDYLIGDVSAGAMYSPDCESVPLSTTFPTDIPAGSYYIGCIIDADNEVPERDETDNTGYSASQLVVQTRVPNVAGMSQSEAVSALTSAGLAVGTKWYAESDTVPADSVLRQDPVAGTPVNLGASVELTVSTGPAESPTIVVPNVVGMAQAAAQSAITAAGLVVGTVTQASSPTTPQGNIISQNPAAGTSVAGGSAVDLVVSSGPSGPTQVQVPNVVGMAQAAAQSAITAAGLVVGTVTQASSATAPQGNIISQNPAAGTSAAKGSAVNLVVSSGPADGPEVKGNIIWVSDGHQTIAGATVPDDQRWVDLLRLQGYAVDYQPPVNLGVGYWQALNATKLAALDAADLVIIGRDTNTGAYANDANEVTQWNGITTPLMLINPYMARGNRWQWLSSTNIGMRQIYFMARAMDPLHPVFAGVTLDDDSQVVWLDPAVLPSHSSYINTADAGNGSVIAARPDNDYIVIAEWAAGIPFYIDSPQTPGDKRMLLSAGTEQTAGTNIGYGVYNLTPEGETMFLNAVAYMTGAPTQAGPIDVENFSFELPGTAKIKGWNAEGVGGTPAVDIPGWSSDGTVADSGVEMGVAPTEGLWTAFLRSRDPAIWQLTNHTIRSGEVFELKVDAMNALQTTAARLTMVLYYEKDGVRMPVAIDSVVLTDTMQEYTLHFDAADVPESIGKKIGIELTNVTPGTGRFLDLDNVQLSLVQ